MIILIYRKMTEKKVFDHFRYIFETGRLVVYVQISL